jgi:hypothetical protein
MGAKNLNFGLWELFQSLHLIFGSSNEDKRIGSTQPSRLQSAFPFKQPRDAYRVWSNTGSGIGPRHEQTGKWFTQLTRSDPKPSRATAAAKPNQPPSRAQPPKKPIPAPTRPTHRR